MSITPCLLSKAVPLTAFIMMGALSGCMAPKTQCYVTLNSAGAPTAEACETGPKLIVRPITETNAVYYVPPYVIGALQYEGYIDMGNLEEPSASDDLTAPGFDSADRSDRTMSNIGSAVALAPDDNHRATTIRGKEARSQIGIASPQDAASSLEIEWPLFDGQSHAAVPRWQTHPRGTSQREEKITVPGGARRLKPTSRIDGEVSFEKPFAAELRSFPISSDLLL
ncbi:hypothetical protein [Fulvimarina sp. MAC8]|uniref:hypothetical protein n=1 Tax=Fulvimarina sp. MAC8 TaxID=3162874 RepID=UPI0032EBA8C3